MTKKIFLALILACFAAFAQANEIRNLTQDFIGLNAEFTALESKSENNASLFSKEKNALKKQKKELLNALPAIVSAQSVNREFMQEFTRQKEKTPSKAAEIELDELFYASLLTLSELFKNAADSELMKESINVGIVALDEHFSTLKNKGENAQNKLNSYIEILQYLSDNAHLFESNYIFAEFRLQNLIDYINSYAKFEFINTGKLVISIAVLLLFWGLRVFLPPFILYYLMKLFFKNSKAATDKAEVREVFINKNKRPFSLLLFFYAFSVCFSIFYYPAPVNLKITNAFYIIYVLLFAWLIIGILNSYGVMFAAKLAQKSGVQNGKAQVANLIIKILNFAILIIAVLLVLANLGFNVSAIIASLGIGGLAVALAAKDIIANFFASIIISFDDSFNQGDLIEVGGIEGNVVETGLRKTTLRTADNSLVFLPNSTMMSANIKNWSKRKVGRHLKMILGIAYDAKPAQLEKCVRDLRDYLAKSPLIAQADDNAFSKNYSAKYRQNLVSVNDLEGYKNDCFVSLCEFANSSINIEIYCYTKSVLSAEFRDARQILMLDFMKIVEQNGLNFAFPSVSVYMEKSGEK